MLKEHTRIWMNYTLIAHVNLCLVRWNETREWAGVICYINWEAHVHQVNSISCIRSFSNKPRSKWRMQRHVWLPMELGNCPMDLMSSAQHGMGKPSDLGQSSPLGFTDNCALLGLLPTNCVSPGDAGSQWPRSKPPQGHSKGHQKSPRSNNFTLQSHLGGSGPFSGHLRRGLVVPLDPGLCLRLSVAV